MYHEGSGDGGREAGGRRPRYSRQSPAARPSSAPCIDPIFGPTQAALYWSSTEFDVTDAWNVNFSSPFFVVSALFKSNEFPVRAVRAGP